MERRILFWQKQPDPLCWLRMTAAERSHSRLASQASSKIGRREKPPWEAGPDVGMGTATV